MANVILENVKKIYDGNVLAVKDFNLTIPHGEFLVLVGPSGCGKSTTLRMVAGLEVPTSGSLTLDGHRITGPGQERGMVFQAYTSFDWLSVRDNVEYGMRINGVPRAERRERADHFIELVGLKGREAYYPRQLSGGQQQRVGIARSLAVEPDLWFLDEPFSALDPLIRREMQDEFLRLQGMLHKTIVFITHDFDEAIRLADHIAVMKDGRVVQVATPEELVLNPATEYVGEFTRHVPRSKVLTLRSVMTPGAPEGETAGDLPETQRIEAVADKVEASPLPFRVVNAEGDVVGSIGGQAVIDVLIGRKPAP